MRQLPLYGSESLVLSARIALEANHISYTTSDAPMNWGAGPSPVGRILVDEADYDRALETIRDLQDTTTGAVGDAYRSPIFRAFVWAVGSAVVWLWLELVLRRHARP